MRKPIYPVISTSSLFPISKVPCQTLIFLRLLAGQYDDYMSERISAVCKLGCSLNYLLKTKIHNFCQKGDIKPRYHYYLFSVFISSKFQREMAIINICSIFYWIFQNVPYFSFRLKNRNLRLQVHYFFWPPLWQTSGKLQT